MKKFAVIALVVLVLGILTIVAGGCEKSDPVGATVTSSDAADKAAMRLIQDELAEAAKNSNNRNFITHLNGAGEVPPRSTHGQGVAKFQFSKDGSSVSYKLIVANISNVVAAHIHYGTATDIGPVIFPLYEAAAGGGRIQGPIAEGSFTAADLVGPFSGSLSLEGFIAALHADSLYVNVHTNDGIDPANTGAGDFPAGEIRGQLR